MSLSNVMNRYTKEILCRIGLLSLVAGFSYHSMYAQQDIEKQETIIIDTYEYEDGSTYKKEEMRNEILSSEQINDLLNNIPEEEGFVSRQVEVKIRHKDGSVTKQRHFMTSPENQSISIFEGPGIDSGDSFGDDMPFRNFLKEFSEEFEGMEFTIPNFEFNMPEFNFNEFNFGLDSDGFFEGFTPGFEGKTYLGIMTEPSEGEGVVIRSVIPDSPAAEAGLAAEDILISIDDMVVNSAADIRRICREKKAGDEVKVKILRGGVPLVLFVEIASRDSFSENFFDEEENPFVFEFPSVEAEDEHMDKQWPWKKGKRKKNILGVSVQELSNYEGLKVIDVVPGSPAETAGIVVDDVIYKFDNKKVDSVDHLKSLLEDKSGETVKIVLRRDNKKKKVSVKLDSKNM